MRAEGREGLREERRLEVSRVPGVRGRGAWDPGEGPAGARPSGSRGPSGGEPIPGDRRNTCASGSQPDWGDYDTDVSAPILGKETGTQGAKKITGEFRKPPEPAAHAPKR